MSSYLYDSNFVIDYFQALSDAVSFYNQCKTNGDHIFFSAITVAEILSVDELQRKAIFETGVISVDKGIAAKAAEIRISQRANHNRRVKTPDSIIIATASLYGYTLVTHDDQMKNVCADIGVSTHNVR